MKHLNTPADGRCGYIAFYGACKVAIYANTSYDAQKMALEHFKPNKAKRHLVHVMLAEKDGEPVFHDTSAI